MAQHETKQFKENKGLRRAIFDCEEGSGDQASETGLLHVGLDIPVTGRYSGSG